MVKTPRITNNLSEKLRVGINLYPEISFDSSQRHDQYIDTQLPLLLKEYREKCPPGFEYSRKLYREFHIDPTKHRPSSEALWRRLKNKGDFPQVNPFVNLTNLLSLKYQICFGLYNLAKINGDITITQGGDEDSFQGIRKDLLHMKGKIIVKDGQGAFGNPSSDSLRTCVDSDTRNILQILFFHRDDPDAEQITRKAFNTYLECFQSRNPSSFIL
jgi:DNA/RNA-binding domain of Phe-tRNA-synthetase-like protein